MQLGSIIKWFNDTIPNNNIKRPVRVNAQVIQYANPEGNSNWYLGRVIHCISNKINQWLTLLNWQMVRICNEIKHSFAFYIMWIGIWNDIRGSCSKLWRGCPLVAWQWIVHDRHDTQLIWNTYGKAKVTQKTCDLLWFMYKAMTDAFAQDALVHYLPNVQLFCLQFIRQTVYPILSIVPVWLNSAMNELMGLPCPLYIRVDMLVRQASQHKTD